MKRTTNETSEAPPLSAIKRAVEKVGGEQEQQGCDDNDDDDIASSARNHRNERQQEWDAPAAATPRRLLVRSLTNEVTWGAAEAAAAAAAAAEPAERLLSPGAAGAGAGTVFRQENPNSSKPAAAAASATSSTAAAPAFAAPLAAAALAESAAFAAEEAAAAAAAAEDPGASSTSAGRISAAAAAGTAAASLLAARRSSPLILDIAADQNSGEVAAGGVLVWRPGHIVRPVDVTSREILQREAERLILRKEEKGRNRSSEEEEEEEDEATETSDVEIDETALMKLVRDAPGSLRWARYVARLTNLDRPEVVNAGGQPEMLFQQLVFPPVVGLLYCFNTRTYKAGDDVASSGFCCTAITPRRKNLSSPPPSPRRDVPFTCKPDAATLATPKYLALATMELKNASAGTLDADDLFNCVLLTSITAMAVVGRCSAAVDFVMVPFVANEGEEATLYAATMHKSWKAPVIKELLTAQLHRLPERVNLIAHLAVLLHWLTNLVASPEATALQSLLRSILKPRGQRDNDESQSATRSSRGGSGDGPNKKARQGSPPTSGGGDNAGDEHRGPPTGGTIRAFASCEGRVTALVPFRRRGGVRDSPRYFWAELHDAAESGVRTAYTREDEDAPAEIVEATAGPVFVKVWREDDCGTSRHRVETEVEHLRAAHRAGVPCPGVISELTQLSIPYNNRLFHRLVMKRLANDPVEQGDLCLYARSLIAAVLRLHRAGILHCDIKPSNVVWDATAKAASLVDFGHAQEEDGATAYPGTAGYTSPEVERNMEPHSRRSDAYSVGKTLGKVCDRIPGVGRRPDEQQVLRVASRLVSEAPTIRIRPPTGSPSRMRWGS